jgi:adenylate cyclase
LINFLEDPDGVGRRYYLRSDAYGWEIPSLPARVAQDLGYEVPEGESILLAWRGGVGTFKHVSYSDLHRDFGRKNRERPADEFRDKIVIVGTAASGLHDLRVTPIASLYPGAEIIATALDNLKNGRWMTRAPEAVPVALALALIGLRLLAFGRRWNAARLAAVLGLASALLAWASYGAVGRGSLVPVLEPLLFAWAFFFAASLIEYLREKRTREQAVKLFSRFLNPQVVSQLVDQGATPESLSGQEKEVTVLFSDIRGFTTHSETHTPGEIVALLNRYFDRQVEVVFRHGGTLDKFIGDCVMAFWGAPVARPDHARAAVAAALEMVEVLEAFKRELAAQGSDLAEAFDVGIGVHSGRAVVGFIGAERKLDYTAIGDTVNLASRIEGLTKGVSRVLASRDTAEACGSAFDFAPRGSYKVKGRTQEVELFEPLRKSVEGEGTLP